MTVNGMETESALRPRSGLTADPYAGSRIATKLRDALTRGSPLRIACLDIDSTLTGDVAMANSVRSLLEEGGYAVTFVTSRSEEMVMSQVSFDASVRAGHFFRPPPHLGHEGNRRVYHPPEDVEAVGVLDGDIIAGSTGTRIMVRRPDGGYLPDLEYEGRFGQSSAEWRETAIDLLDRAEAKGCPVTRAAIEWEDNYQSGLSDIAPPDFRIQLNFDTVEDKLRFVACARDMIREGMARAQDGGTALRNLRFTDDSKPENGGYKVFITPRLGSKVRAVERFVDRLCRGLHVSRSRLEILFAGDSFPDLEMGLLGGLGTISTFLLAGGSRLAWVLTDENTETFAGEHLRSIRRRLTPAGSAGHYHFRIPCARQGSRNVIVGDLAFPGTDSVETVHAYVRAVRS